MKTHSGLPLPSWRQILADARHLIEARAVWRCDVRNLPAWENWYPVRFMRRAWGRLRYKAIRDHMKGKSIFPDYQ
jgi:hypothetical protein